MKQPYLWRMLVGNSVNSLLPHECMADSSIQDEREFREMMAEVDPSISSRLLVALDFAKGAHAGQTRKSGEPFILHPIAVGYGLWKKYEDPELAAAGFLHDTIEDCEDVSRGKIYEVFGDTVGFLVDAATKNLYDFHLRPEVVFEDKIERLLWAGMQDMRVLLLKIADREHNISTLAHLKNNRQVRMAFETQAIFQPLRNILRIDTKMTLPESTKNLYDFLEKNNLKSPKDLKEFLYQQCYQNFNDDVYKLVYEDSDKIIWEIEDMTIYENLCNLSDFQSYIDVISMWTNGRQFKVLLSFKKGYVIDEPNISLKISSFKN